MFQKAVAFGAHSLLVHCSPHRVVLVYSKGRQQGRYAQYQSYGLFIYLFYSRSTSHRFSTFQNKGQFQLKKADLFENQYYCPVQCECTVVLAVLHKDASVRCQVAKSLSLQYYQQLGYYAIILYLLFKSKQKSCKLFIAFGRNKKLCFKKLQLLVPIVFQFTVAHTEWYQYTAKDGNKDDMHSIRVMGYLLIYSTCTCNVQQIYFPQVFHILE